MLIATPDFGASGIIVLFVLAGWLVLLLLIGMGIFFGARMCRSKSMRSKTVGRILIIVSVLAPVAAAVAPPFVFRLAYGGYPIGHYPSDKIKGGMSSSEVTAILGPPHERYKRGNEETYLYYLDSFGVHYCGVIVGSDGTVDHLHGN